MKKETELRALAVVAVGEAQAHGLTPFDAQTVFLYAAAHLNAATHLGALQRTGDADPKKRQERIAAATATFAAEFDNAVAVLSLTAKAIVEAEAMECDACGEPATEYVSIDQSLDAGTSEEGHFYLCDQHGGQMRELARACKLTSKRPTDPWLDQEAKILIWPEPDNRPPPLAVQPSEEMRTCRGCADHIFETFAGVE